MNWDIATSRFKKLFRFLEWRSQKEEILFWKNLLSTVVLQAMINLRSVLADYAFTFFEALLTIQILPGALTIILP